MNAAKIQISAEELALIEDAGWILTKNGIIHKLFDLFGMLAGETANLLQASGLPEEIKKSTAKISRGEQYKGLPYVVLDYPRVFTKQDVFAIRILFWWAHYFSLTWHLKGVYLERFGSYITDNLDLLASHDFYLSISADEWQHELNEQHYVKIREVNKQEVDKILRHHPFVKLSVKIPLGKWNQAGSLLLEQFSVVMRISEQR
ncbi:MAG TPA: hypothetical protein VMI35_06855 [Puia sp.]|nr:hypothetical protein [Puia sp.]